jgi:hypothetical protein
MYYTVKVKLIFLCSFAFTMNNKCTINFAINSIHIFSEGFPSLYPPPLRRKNGSKALNV